MAGELKSITCDPACGFMVRSHDEEEVVRMTMEHVKTMHPDQEMTPDQIRAMVKTAKTA